MNITESGSKEVWQHETIGGSETPLGGIPVIAEMTPTPSSRLVSEPGQWRGLSGRRSSVLGGLAWLLQEHALIPGRSSPGAPVVEPSVTKAILAA